MSPSGRPSRPAGIVDPDVARVTGLAPSPEEVEAFEQDEDPTILG
jgi:hypothetical protein